MLTGNTAVDQQLLTDMRSADPLGAQVLETQLQYTDKMCGNWRLGDDSQVKDAFYPNLQSALLGQRSPKAAIDARSGLSAGSAARLKWRPPFR